MALSRPHLQHHNPRKAMIAVAKQGRAQLVDGWPRSTQERMAAAEASAGLPPDVPRHPRLHNERACSAHLSSATSFCV